MLVQAIIGALRGANPRPHILTGINMDRDYLARICDARDVLCGYCQSGDCFMCTVHHLVADAFSELNDVEVEEDA